MSHLHRRSFLCRSAALGAGVVAAPLWGTHLQAADEHDVRDIGGDRELFLDRWLIDRLAGGARQQLHHPVPREVSLTHDDPWEGTGSGYHSIFFDRDRYRMYYKAWHIAVGEGKVDTGQHPLFCCYAESPDGIHWEKPALGLHEFNGSRQNNIVMASGPLGPLHVDAGHPAVFLDENPDSPPQARYKAIVRSSKPNGLLPFSSPDGLHWTPMTDAPMLSGLGAFDSQNLAFWDPNIGRYRAYWRIFSEGIRAIRTATSDDLIHWGPHTDLTYVDSPAEHLYTNQIKPYYRAPQILLGLPTRYVDRGWSKSMRALPASEQRERRSSASERYGTAVTEALVMASRDGTSFTRWNEAFLRPGIQRPDAWNYGHQYIGWQIVETASTMPGAPPEMSLYASESYWHGKGSALRRYTLRPDGFVSVAAPASGGELITPPLQFSGSELTLNFATSAAGRVRVELQSLDGTPLEGYRLEDCPDLFGDTLDRVVSWKTGSDLARLSGQPVRLRFELADADLYSLQFRSADRRT